MSLSLDMGNTVVETIHGVRVADPYRWLEDRDAPATEEWLRTQKTRFNDYFQRLGDVDNLRNRVNAFLDIEATDQLGKVHDCYFYRKRKRGDQQPSIYVKSASTGKERLLVDPRILGPYASVGIYAISPDARLLAYDQRYGGEQTKAVHFVEVDSGRVLRDSLDSGYALGLAFRIVGDGYYYCHDLVRTSSATPDADYSIRFHRFGSPSCDDESILNLPRHPGSKVVLGSDGDGLSAVLYRKCDSRYCVDVYIAKQGDHYSWRCIASAMQAPFNPFFSHGILLVVDQHKSANGELIELDPEDCSCRRVIVPHWISPLQRLVILGECIYLSYLLGTESVLRVWSLRGEFLGEIPLEKGFTWWVHAPYSSDADELFLSSESFTRPLTIYSLDPSSWKRRLWSQLRVPSLDPSIVRRTVSYPTKDGTLVSMSLIAPSGTELKDLPIVMTAYGGFGVAMTPRFSTFVAIMLELGFAFALPEIRGGGERGPEWHAAARGRNRQVAFDDFIAAAQWLCETGITHPEKLAAFGGSNSGLLVGAAITQQPALFRAAFCIAPLLDMLRYHLFDRAYVWSDEYGTADNPEDFRALSGYSPYHRITEAQNYPAMFLIAGDRDTRCNPAHVRKMVARLQNRPAQHYPVLLDYSAERGHAPTMPVSVRTAALTNRIAFICHELNVPLDDRRIPARVLTLALGFLLRVDWHLRRHKSTPLQNILKSASIAKDKVRFSPRQLSYVVDVACTLYLKEVKCLQRSVVLTMLLRRYGWPGELVIAGRTLPSKFHAWVEINGKVVNDKPYIESQYKVLMRS